MTWFLTICEWLNQKRILVRSIWSSREALKVSHWMPVDERTCKIQELKWVGIWDSANLPIQRSQNQISIFLMSMYATVIVAEVYKEAVYVKLWLARQVYKDPKIKEVSTWWPCMKQKVQQKFWNELQQQLTSKVKTDRASKLNNIGLKQHRVENP